MGTPDFEFPSSKDKEPIREETWKHLDQLSRNFAASAQALGALEQAPEEKQPDNEEEA